MTPQQNQTCEYCILIGTEVRLRKVSNDESKDKRMLCGSCAEQLKAVAEKI